MTLRTGRCDIRHGCCRERQIEVAQRVGGHKQALEARLLACGEVTDKAVGDGISGVLSLRTVARLVGRPDVP
jgi:hypothetical protein